MRRRKNRSGSVQLQAKAILQLRGQQQVNEEEVSLYVQFKAKYKHDLAGFAAECIQWQAGKGMTAYQFECMRELVTSKRVCLRGPHGLGKTALAAICVLWFALTRDGEDWKVITTASAWRQLTKYLWPEIGKWSRLLKWELIGRSPFNERTELLTQSLKLSTGEALAVASDNAALIEGAHADNILYVLDEAKAIQIPTWDAAEGAMSTGDAHMLAISTPGEPQGRFYDIQNHKAGYEDWYVRHVTRSEQIKAGRMTVAWAEQRRKQWGKDSQAYQNRVEGNFASSDEDSVISLAWVERANERWLAMEEAGLFGELDTIGVDVGRGRDPSVIARKHDMAILKLYHSSKKTIMPLTGLVVAILRKNPNCRAKVDVIGVGAGVVDRAREVDDGAYEERVIAWIAGEKTAYTDSSDELGFADLRSFGWWHMRELLMDENSEVALPPDPKLIGDLTAPRWREISGGKIKVEAKDQIKKRLKRSTDDGDAVVMAYCPDNDFTQTVAAF